MQTTEIALHTSLQLKYFTLQTSFFLKSFFFVRGKVKVKVSEAKKCLNIDWCSKSAVGDQQLLNYILQIVVSSLV